MEEAVAFIKRRSREVDPQKKGLNIILRERDLADAPGLTMELENIPVSELIRYICQTTGLKYKVEEHAVIIADVSIAFSQLQTRFYPVPVTFSKLKGQLGSQGIKDLFSGLGVDFPAGAKLQYIKSVSRLVDRQRLENMPVSRFLERWLLP